MTAKPHTRSDGPSWDELAAADINPVPAFLQHEAAPDLGSDPIPVERYTSPEWHQRELDKLWPYVWQFAARHEEMPNPGDTVVYDNAGRSYLLVRQEDGSVRAFHNVCLHRGRQLRDRSGKAGEIRCPYHGFTWNTDGSLKSIPSQWDFQHLKADDMKLPAAEVAHWQGYIFIREESGGPTIEEYLGPLVDHFQRWRHEDCQTTIWVGMVIPANWKACAEAFMEAYHTIATHPQILPFTGDCNTKYYAWGDHVNLALTPFGISSPHIADKAGDEQWVIDQFSRYNGRVLPAGVQLTVPEGGTARRAMGEYNRKRLGEMSGRDFSSLSDSEVQDAFTYNVFPNFAPWGGFTSNVLYRWRPWHDQDHCLMEVRLLGRRKPDEPVTPCPPMLLLEWGESWETHLGQLGAVLMQDMGNLPKVQKGMKQSKTRKLQLANYQEIRIRQFHKTLEKYLDR